ncbi:MAG: VWA domain-containing protein [Paracoccaceae bacterium]
MTDDIGLWFELFHFLRPLWLLTLLPIAAIWWIVRPRKRKPEAQASGIAPHLAQALTVNNSEDQKVYPIDATAIILALLTVAVAGPTWSRVANPLLAQTAPLAVALKVSPSMESPDIQPSRLERASFKILDLVERRAGAQTALFAYAGSAHRVTPLTEDPNIVRSYLEGLSPDVMPVEGDRADLALEMTIKELQRTETPGALLFVLDDMSPANVTVFSTDPDSRPVVVFLIAGPDDLKLPQLDKIPNASVVRLSADERDIDTIERRVLSAYREALSADDSQSWNDKGWLLSLPVAFLILLWFRRGWTMQWAFAFLLVAAAVKPAQAEGIKDWFFTPDQQGWMAYQDKEFAEASELFQDPQWIAFSQFKAGKYAEAAESYARIETAQGALGEGLARLRNREYREGVRAFEKALKRDPEFAAAEENLAVAQAIVAFVESTQSQSDTGEEAGIGADDVVFDNESGLGAETQIERSDEAPVVFTTEQWMQSVDTDVSDFLHSRFRLEQSGGEN